MLHLEVDSIDASPPYKPKRRSLVFQWALFLCKAESAILGCLLFAGHGGLERIRDEKACKGRVNMA